MAGQGHENQSLGIAVLEPSSPSAPGVFEQNLTDIRNRGIRTDVITYDTGAGERLAESGVRERVRMLSSALLESDCDYVMAARGGYGASDLLRHLDWQALAKIPTKIMVGFSDISALHAACIPGLAGLDCMLRCRDRPFGEADRMWPVFWSFCQKDDLGPVESTCSKYPVARSRQNSTARCSVDVSAYCLI